MAEDEQQRRVCRTCGETFPYPGHNSLATRSICERYVAIPEEAARVMRILRRRVDQLTREVEKLRGENSE
jgi:hypothetical protein